MKPPVTVAEIVRLQPQYKSPKQYKSWRSHICSCAAQILDCAEFLADPDCKDDSKYATRACMYGVLHKTLSLAAPAYYLSKELCCSLFKTAPVFPVDAPIAMPAFHLMVPAGLLSDNPAVVIAYAARSDHDHVFDVPENMPPGYLLLGILFIVDKIVYAFTVTFTSDFSDIWIHPDLTRTPEGIFSEEEARYHGSLQITAAKLAVNALLIMQYQPELLTVDRSVSECGSGFRPSASKPPSSYMPLRWIGKTYQRKTDKQTPAGSHASPRAHWRKGHWHHFRHGAGRKQLKLKWIEPIFVNA